MRTCISVNDSPPGNRKPLGYRCTVRHSGSLSRSLSSAPVHSPKSHSSRPRSLLHLQAEGLGDGRRGLAGALERRRVDRGDLVELGDARGGRVGLVASLVGEVQARGPTRQLGAGGGRLAVADEQDRGGRRRLRLRGAGHEVLNSASAWNPESVVAPADGQVVVRPAVRPDDRLAPARRAARTVPVVDSLERLTADVVACRACPRLVAWREQVALEKRAALPRRRLLGPTGTRLR